MSRTLRARTVAVALSVVFAAVATAGVASAQDDDLVYVALGDSAAAGPLLPQQDPTSPGCLRSDINYPTLVASRIGATELRDVTCSKATTANLTGPQDTFSGTVAPQLDAVTEDADVVTVHIGANDVDIVGVVLGCVQLGPEPFGVSCRDTKYAKNGNDTVSKRIQEFAPKIGALAREIHDRAPDARVDFVGYGTYLRPGGCFPRQLIWARDADYIQAKVNELNAVVRDQARANGAGYISQSEASAGHDACAADPRERWFEGLIPGSQTAPFHPTVLGMQGTAAVVAGRLEQESARS